MSELKQPFSVNYRISDIRELELSIPLLSEELIENFEEDNLDFGFNIDYVWNLEQDLFSVVIEVNYVYDRESLNENMLKYTGEIEFKVEELNKFIDTEKPKILLPQNFLGALTGITISTIRGMIAMRTFGKFQGDFYIPILNPMQVVQGYLAENKVENELAE